MRGIVTDGQSIKRLRKLKGLTQERLAKQAGCHQRTVRNAEVGRPVDSEVLHSIAECLETAVENLKANAEIQRQNKSKFIIHNQLVALNNSDAQMVCESFAENAVLIAPRQLVGNRKKTVGLIFIRSRVNQLMRRFQLSVTSQPKIDFVNELAFLRCSMEFIDLRHKEKKSSGVCVEYTIHNAQIVSQTIFLN